MENPCEVRSPKICKKGLADGIKGLFNNIRVGRLAPFRRCKHRLPGRGVREVEDDAALISPEIEIAGDELRALIDTDRLGMAGLSAHPIQGRYHILSAVAEPRVEHRRETAAMLG